MGMTLGEPYRKYHLCRNCGSRTLNLEAHQMYALCTQLLKLRPLVDSAEAWLHENDDRQKEDTCSKR